MKENVSPLFSRTLIIKIIWVEVFRQFTERLMWPQQNVVVVDVVVVAVLVGTC